MHKEANACLLTQRSLNDKYLPGDKQFTGFCVNGLLKRTPVWGAVAWIRVSSHEVLSQITTNAAMAAAVVDFILSRLRLGDGADK